MTATSRRATRSNAPAPSSRCPKFSICSLRIAEIFTAQVVTAQELSETQKSALLGALKQAVGSKVQMDITVDGSLIGGLVVKVGSRMIDTSLRSKLQRLELAMKGAG